MMIDHELNSKAVKYLGLAHFVNHETHVINIADKGVAREFTLENPEDLLAVVMKVGKFDREMIYEWLAKLP